jgi:hypothetical protein
LPATPRPIARRRLSGRRIIGWGAAACVAAGVLPLAVAADGSASQRAPQHRAAPASRVADAPARAAAKPHPRFPGHRPGRIYLGMSCDNCGTRAAQIGRGVGLIRTYVKWGNWEGVAKDIVEARRAHRLPWISVEGPDFGAPTGWRSVGRGHHDRDIRQLARVIKRHDDRPLFISFDHEMSNNAPDSLAHWWASGYNRFYDVLKAAHALRRVAVPPIFVAWLFDPNNPQDPGKWLPPSTLRRASFMGIDLYQADNGKAFGQRLPDVYRWLARQGHPRMMIGLAETGATDAFGNVSGASWLNRSLRWSARHANRVAAISYFNSTANSDPRMYWPLDESSRKIDVYRKWLATRVFIDRVR